MLCVALLYSSESIISNLYRVLDMTLLYIGLKRSTIQDVVSVFIHASYYYLLVYNVRHVWRSAHPNTAVDGTLKSSQFCVTCLHMHSDY